MQRLLALGVSLPLLVCLGAGPATAQLPTAPPSAPPAPAVAPAVPAPVAPVAAKAHPIRRKRARAISASPLASGPTVSGNVAKILPSGLAAAPAGAPPSVKVLIWTANRLIGLPYKWGGGHGAFSDSGYDCSGSVSYALHAAGMLSYPEDSSGLESWGARGPARWVTVYTNPTHAWMIVAGIRLDTSAVADPGGLDGPRWRPASRPTGGFRVRHFGGEHKAPPLMAPAPAAPLVPTPAPAPVLAPGADSGQAAPQPADAGSGVDTTSTDGSSTDGSGDPGYPPDASGDPGSGGPSLSG